MPRPREHYGHTYEDQVLSEDYDPEAEESEWGGRQPNQPHCNRCGSTDVRWRQQTGRWVLFSNEPGKLHQCPIEDDFEAVE